MREWLTNALLDSAESIPEEAEGYILGRGLPYRLMEEMRVGVWRCPEAPCPDGVFDHRHGTGGSRVDHWLSIPLWSPRGRVVGVEFRRWDGEKSVSKYFLPDTAWSPVFAGMTPSSLNRIWKGGDIWLVEGIFDLALTHAIPDKDVALSCGGAKITPNQVSFIQRFLDPQAMVHVAFDMDETGRKMAQGYQHPDTGRRVWGVVERLEREGIRCRDVQYRGKDPGDVWERTGTSGLQRAFRL
jgi:hypothetical protein